MMVLNVCCSLSLSDQAEEYNGVYYRPPGSLCISSHLVTEFFLVPRCYEFANCGDAECGGADCRDLRFQTSSRGKMMCENKLPNLLRIKLQNTSNCTRRLGQENKAYPSKGQISFRNAERCPMRAMRGSVLYNG
jgi:hypothetical protein